MTRRLVLLVAGLGLWAGAGARSLLAQHVRFYVPDTALTILTGRTATAELWVQGGGGVSAYNITIFLDDSRVRLVAADTVPGYGLSVPTVTKGTEQVTLAASGPGSVSSTVILAKLTFEMDAAATLGSLLSLRVNSLVNGSGLDVLPTHRTDLLNVCQAVKIGGDVTGDRTINSRDALVALTAAVGLPTGGFDVPVGDVDADGQVTSRDALFILSYGIGLTVYIYDAPLLGKWLPNSCAPLALAPSDLVFWRAGTLYKVASGDSIPFSLGLSGINTYYARWSHDSTRLVFTQSISGYGYEVMVANADGTGLAALTLNSANDFAPDWSPDGSKIAFVSNRVSPQSIYLMNADGSGQTRLTTTHTVIDLAWSPDNVRIAFTGYSTCCTSRLWTVDVADGSKVAEVFVGSDAHQPRDPVWSPSGDSLVYYSQSRGRVYKVSASGDTLIVSSLNNLQDSPWWTNAAHTLRSYVRYPYDFFLRRFSDGRHLRLTRGQFADDLRLALARALAPPSLVYVDTVTVSPDSVGIDPDSTALLTATVKNNDGKENLTAPVGWASRDTTVAVVNDTGLVTGKNPGTTYVVATSGWRTDSAKVAVVVALASVSAGGFHSCGLGADGRAYCWGYNTNGQLGTGTTVVSSHPMRVAGGLKFAAITTGMEHSCGLDSAGAGYCWGDNARGQLGDGGTTDRSVPTLVSGGPFASIEAGWQFTCAVATAGNVGHCWGANTKGQLGDGTTTDRLTPTPVKGGADIPFDSMTAAAEHACGVTTTGVGYCWGDNLNGRLGDGTTTARLSPTLITGGLSWVSVSAFDVHSCGVAADNVPYCWGGNGNGQLGDGTTTNRLSPTGISGGPSYPSVMTGNFHTCAVDGLNAAFCWGRNFEGQLGDGTTNQRNVPTAVTGSLLVAAVSPGYLHTCAISAAISASSVVYCWGRNAEGQLGDQTLTQRNAPTRVAGQK